MNSFRRRDETKAKKRNEKQNRQGNSVQLVPNRDREKDPDSMLRDGAKRDSGKSGN